MGDSVRAVRRPSPGGGEPTADELLLRVARGSEAAFEQLYDIVAPPVFGVVRRVLRDVAQAEEVTQEVLVELWRTATRYDRSRGSAITWALTLAHRRAVDRVRSAQARADREERAGAMAPGREFDEVAEAVTARLEREQVHRCLSTLTELQRESVLLAYYGGHTYPEVAKLLDSPLGTIKTRLRDGLIRLRDCLGVTR
ncbi:ECF RNA polymerase sigma factor SigK [Saccharomonospora piscinae]|uniref:RNA polymerase subunit sigma n=1 Tax=Saccharomonospora piscinae TaxID=687388 RepID=A0A1V9ACQ3_SACPI|nr:ECF RNA polymerase sigma factor SigK [Saccharomonospora piscinae]OQO94704.1 RNA polymerase subunit sigma [Saccharomonospora piscinae]TLW94591.1 sigma-70 family RNA polymerase sigma factor [Saccharomonospora piscinae]